MKVMQCRWLMILTLCACAMIDVSQCRHHFKKSKKLASRESLEKKFKIMAHPQDRPDMMTVVMKGKDGPPGSPGQQGDAGKPGPQGPKGAQGDKGLPGVCSRTQCENEQLKSIIQRLLALEKYVNSKLNNSSSKNKSEGDTDSKACNKNLAGRGTFSPTLPPCPVASTLIAIMPLYPPAPPKAPQGNTKNKCQGQATNNARPSTGQGQNQGQGQGQGIAPTAGSPTLSGTTPAAAATTGKPSYAPCPTTPAATPAPTPTKSTSSKVFPSAPFYVTLQGVTSYDSAPMMVPPQPPQATVYGGPLNPFKAVPANWVTSGVGPIDLKPALYSQTQGKTTAQQNFVSPAWTMTKKNKIPSLHHGLLTHKLAAKKLSVSAAYMKSTKKSRKIIFHHHKITKGHYKTLIRKHIEKKTPEKNHQQLTKTRKAMAKKTH